ncbi:hypothetical protein QBC39DRAFT_438071 [Podospora conica]|nr:hypothetical protein QBC39DRAFT_438071 [Schizothecium conicum]
MAGKRQRDAQASDDDISSSGSEGAHQHRDVKSSRTENNATGVCLRPTKPDGPFRGDEMDGVVLDIRDYSGVSTRLAQDTECHTQRHGDIMLYLVTVASVGEALVHGGFGVTYRALDDCERVPISKAWHLTRDEGLNLDMLEAIGVAECLYQANQVIRQAILENKLENIDTFRLSTHPALATYGKPIQVVIGTENKNVYKALNGGPLFLDSPDSLTFSPPKQTSIVPTDPSLWQEVLQLAVQASRELHNLPGEIKVEIELRLLPMDTCFGSTTNS